jgi:hypothetical protein
MHRGLRGIRVGTIALALVVTAAGCSSSDAAANATASTKPTTATTAPTSTTASTTSSGHHHEGGAEADPKRPSIVEFHGDERQKLGDQLVEVRRIALRYPTVADAEAAGYELTTPYAPGTGAHYGKDSDTQPPGQPLDLTKPQSYLYDGTDPDSRLVGVMYVQLGGDTAPEGFAGPLDTWNAFPGQCLKKGTTDPVFPTKDSVTEAECTKANGTFIDITAWIQHVWVVPGWEAPGGVFAPYNSDIVCADGTTDADDVNGCPAPD